MVYDQDATIVHFGSKRPKDQDTTNDVLGRKVRGATKDVILTTFGQKDWESYRKLDKNFTVIWKYFGERQIFKN